MTAQRGPQRLILIRSGVYDFAEIELDEPLHLVAANNTGKTTLIAALQFLYLDNFQQMYFAHSRDATKRYYFAHPNSFIMFECMTQVGLRVVGVRGLGPGQGYGFQRFTYEGAFEREDFLDGRVSRSWEDVRTRLLDRRLQNLEAKDLHRALVGSHSDVVLGLVPLRSAATYESFGFLFRNLLRLSHLPASELINLLIKVNQHELSRVAVDLRRDFEDQYRTAKQQAAEVEELAAVEPHIETALSTIEKRDNAQAACIVTWQQLQVAAQAEHKRLTENLQAAVDDEQRLADELSDVEQRRTELDFAIDDHNRRAAVTRAEIAHLDELRERFAQFDADVQRRRRTDLQAQFEDLVGRLHGLADDDLARVQRELDRVRSGLQRNRQLLANLADAAVTYLRQRSQLSDEDLERVFSMIHPDLLRVRIGADGADVRDEAGLFARLRTIAASFDKDGYCDDTVRLPASVLPEPPDLAVFSEPERIQEEVSQLERRAHILEQKLQDIRRRAELEERRDQADQQIKRLDRDLANYADWREAEEGRAELEEGLVDIERTLAELVEQRDANTQLRDRFKADIAEAQRRQKRQREQIQELGRKLDALEPPPDMLDSSSALDPSQSELAVGELPLDTLLGRFHKMTSKYERYFQEAQTHLKDIDHRTTSRYAGKDEASTVENLIEAREALDDQRQALSELWQGIVRGLHRELQDLRNSLDKLKQQVSRLNRSLGARQISNLAGLRLVVRENERLVAKIDTVLEWERAPLFVGGRAAQESLQSIANLLEDYPQLRLEQLFELRFQIEDASGAKKSFEALDRIESQGTTTTIKVIIHLELLRMLLEEDRARIPFFLDEVSVLDDQNLRGIIEHARQMNFVPLVASPDARDCVDTLYFLSASEGRVVLDCRSRMRLDRQDEDEHDALARDGEVVHER
ncbi:hypothetical protein FIV42_15600 [Persicimonas caeni]|uniref:ATP-binding protein n=1 Tax=Persicimonas caeni TaxID=2292766 RepID=A0A4Y6PUV3_PERCE|nr:hypothetical protein [Persicimonas caeni]QDG52116.1 hypothetical protein FIV42_15600 [Persicimonas caeni]QED33337.1 hypothetical protein FRD00_15595 [Persicimonas caeni]